MRIFQKNNTIGIILDVKHTKRTSFMPERAQFFLEKLLLWQYGKFFLSAASLPPKINIKTRCPLFLNILTYALCFIKIYIKKDIS